MPRRPTPRPRLAPPDTPETSTFAQLVVQADWRGAFVKLSQEAERGPGHPRPDVVCFDLFGHALQLVGTNDDGRGRAFFEADSVDAVEHLAKALLDGAATFRRLRRVYELGEALAPAEWGAPA